MPVGQDQLRLRAEGVRELPFRKEGHGQKEREEITPFPSLKFSLSSKEQGSLPQWNSLSVDRLIRSLSSESRLSPHPL